MIDPNTKMDGRVSFLGFWPTPNSKVGQKRDGLMNTFNFDATDKTDDAIRVYSADAHSCITNNHGYLVIFFFKQKYASLSGISPSQQVADNTEIEK